MKLLGNVGEISEDVAFRAPNGDFIQLWAQEFRDVDILVLGGIVSVKFGGNIIFSALKLPPSVSDFKGSDFYFAARTGGAVQTHFFDDIKIDIYE